MVRRLFLFCLLIITASCGVVKKKTSYGKERRVYVEAREKDSLDAEVVDTAEIPKAPVPERADNIINTALGYSGVKYKYGGTTPRGMDCSGLLYISFAEHDVQLPRVSYLMAREGTEIRLREVNKGDLLFFKTQKRSRRINHVGLVVAVEGDKIQFIHATSSRGVIVSSLQEGYWTRSFVKATRIL